MSCRRKLYHWLLGFALTALDVVLPPRDEPDRPDGGPPKAPDLTVALRSLLLRLPSMNGTMWTPAADVSQAMLDAWPVWETNQAEFPARAQPPLELLRSMGCYGSGWRPLRLPGMNDSGDGVLLVRDLTSESVARCQWQRYEKYCGGWRTYHPPENLAEEHFYHGLFRVRPAIWAELDKS